MTEQILALAESVMPQQRQQQPIQQLVRGQWYTARLEPMSFWRARLPVDKSSAIIQLNLTLVGDSTEDRVAAATDVAIYGRRGSLPSVTTHDWAHLVTSSGMIRRLPRSVAASAVTVERSLTRGEWFIAVLNDVESRVRTLRATVDEVRRPPLRRGEANAASGACLEDCHGRGRCLRGKCQCEPQFSGADCSLSKSFA